MRTKILALTIVFILTVASFTSLASALEICVEETDFEPNPVDSEVVEVTKMIKDSDSWVNQLNASIDDVLRFKISITYHDSDGDGAAYMIRNIRITDTLPEGLQYLGDATSDETSVEDNVIIWDFGFSFHLNESYPTFSLEFDVKVVGYGELVNHVYVYAMEKCISRPRHVNQTATVSVSSGTVDCVFRDIENDGNDESACDCNEDPSDGYESYTDSNGPTSIYVSIDGDNDGKIDHFIDSNMITIPEVSGYIYWDPDNNILDRFIETRDVDYDGNPQLELIYDSNGDGKQDRYYDPDDGKIYPYVVYILTTDAEGDGNGFVEVQPNGKKFLENWNVELFAVAAEDGSNFDYWTGDVSDDDKNKNPLEVVMDEDKTIVAHFSKNDLDDKPEIDVIKPKENRLYKFNIPIRTYLQGTKIVGPITIKVEAKSDNGIDRVEFYIDGKLKRTDRIGLLNVYKWTWLTKPIDDKSNYTIKIVAYDKLGNSNFTEFEVTRERYKPIRDTPILSAGVLLAGFMALLRNRSSEPDERIIDDDDDGSDDYDDKPYEDDYGDEEKVEPVDTKDGDNEDDLFWYIVSALTIILFAMIGFLFFGRKIYE